MKSWIWVLALALVFSGCTGGKTAQQANERKIKVAQQTKAHKAAVKAKKAAARENSGAGKAKNASDKANSPAAAERTGTKTGMGQGASSIAGADSRTAAALEMNESKQDVVLFLNRAEQAIPDIIFAAMNNASGKTVTDGGVTYRQLPADLDSKEEIIAYFSRFWSRPIAAKMYGNLPVKIVGNTVYVARPEEDYPVLISTRNTSVQVVRGEITAVVSDITLPAFARERTVQYHLVRDPDTGQYRIDKRTGSYGSEMFQ